MLDPDKAAQYKGKISVYDDPIYIADAALYLKAHQPGPRDRRTRTSSTRISSTPRSTCSSSSGRTSASTGPTATKQIQAFTNGDDEVGTTWQYQYFTLLGEGDPVASTPASAGLPARGGRDRMVGHLDDQLRGRASELHVHVDEPHHRAEGPGARSRSGSARRRPREGVPSSDQPTRTSCRHASYHADRPETFWKRVYYWNTPLADCGDDRGDVVQGLQRLGLGLDRDQGVVARSWKPVAQARRRRGGRWAAGSPTSSTAAPGSRSAALLAGPVGWLVIGYLGSLAVLLVAAFWSVDALSGEVEQTLHPRQLQDPGRRARLPDDRRCGTIAIAALVTLTDILLAFPIAFYMAKVASAADEGAARRRRPAAAVVELPGQGLRLAHDPLDRRRSSTGLLDPLGLTAPATATSPSGW